MYRLLMLGMGIGTLFACATGFALSVTAPTAHAVYLRHTCVEQRTTITVIDEMVAGDRYIRTYGPCRSA